MKYCTHAHTHAYTHARAHTYERMHARTQCVYMYVKCFFGGNEIRLTTLNTYFFVINHFGEFVV